MVVRKKCTIIILVVGVLLLALGCIFIPVFKNLIHSEIKKKIPLVKGSDTYKDWADPPVPIYFQIYVFDLENPIEAGKGAMPSFAQKGPYTYREHRHKFDITINKNNDTISYREARTFNYDKAMSPGLLESDNFTTVNLPFLTIVEMIQYEYSWLKTLVDDLLILVNDENLFITLSVSDLIWGYEDNLLKEAHKILAKYNVSVPDKFGLFMGQNGTDDGLYNIDSGLGPKGVETFNVINSWNGQFSLDFWKTRTCNMINGTDGTIFPPFVEKSDVLFLFSSDICRSLYATYSKESQVRGIDTYHFKIPPETFENGKINNANFGFCSATDISPDHSCLPSGLLNASTCRSGAPVVMSQPNFLAADPIVQNAVKGLQAIDQDHSTILDVDPLTGVVMNAQKKLQINVLVKRIDGFIATESVRTLVFPVMWLNESAEIDEKTANDYKSQVLGPLKITQGVQYGLIGLGGFLILCAIIMFIIMFTNRKNEKELVDITDTNNERLTNDRPPNERSPLVSAIQT